MTARICSYSSSTTFSLTALTTLSFTGQSGSSHSPYSQLSLSFTHCPCHCSHICSGFAFTVPLTALVHDSHHPSRKSCPHQCSLICESKYPSLIEGSQHRSHLLSASVLTHLLFIAHSVKRAQKCPPHRRGGVSGHLPHAVHNASDRSGVKNAKMQRTGCSAKHQGTGAGVHKTKRALPFTAAIRPHSGNVRDVSAFSTCALL